MREYGEFDLASFDTDEFTVLLLGNLQPTATSSENIEINNHSSKETSSETKDTPLVNQEVVTQNASFTGTEKFDPKEL